MKIELYQKVKLKDGRVGFIIEDFGNGEFLFDYPLYENGKFPKGRKYNYYEQEDITMDDISEIMEEPIKMEKSTNILDGKLSD